MDTASKDSKPSVHVHCMREAQGKEPPVSQLLGLSTGKSEKTGSGDLESTAILWIDLDDG